MITSPETFQEPLTPPDASALTAPNAFVSNVEQVLVPGGHATDKLAAKIGEISERAVWYGHDVVILPSEPDPDFVEYANSFGLSPTIIVPRNVDMNRLSIRDGMSDPTVVKALGGTWVESYIGDQELYVPLQHAGIRYGGGDPGDTVQFVNDKGNFAGLVDGLVAVPPGGLFRGIGNIATAVLERVAEEGSAFVRHTHSGGGFGNRLIRAEEIATMSRAEALGYICNKLCDSRPDLWEEGSALVEQTLELGSSPTVNFNTLDDEVIDGEQITHESNNWGCWLPAPPWRYVRGEIIDIGRGTRERVSSKNFWGRANVDLGKRTDLLKLVSFEINGRSTAVRHPVAIATRLWGPFEDWVKKGRTVKALDHFELNKGYTFRELHKTLAEAKLLASLENPFGALITIPPKHGVAGIQVMGKGYEDTEMIYRQVNNLVGNRVTNTEDYPIFTDDMQRI